MPRFAGAVGACEIALVTGVVVVDYVDDDVDDVVVVATADCRLLALLVVDGLVGALLKFLVRAELFHWLLLLAELFEWVRDLFPLVVGVVVVVVVLVVSAYY